MTSVFRWEGSVQEEKEALLIVKTSEEQLQAVQKLIREKHSYEVPEMISVPISGGHEPYLKWLLESVGA